MTGRYGALDYSQSTACNSVVEAKLALGDKIGIGFKGDDIEAHTQIKIRIFTKVHPDV